MPYGLSFSQTRKEIETILGESKKPERVYDLRDGFYPSKLINIQYLSVDSGSKPYEIQFYKEGFYNESF